MEKKAPVRILVIDVLKPHKPNILELGQIISQKSGADVNISVYAVDEKTESVKLVLSGKDIDYSVVNKSVEDAGAVIHSIDKVVIGKKDIIELPPEPKPIK